jgi:hypothetical protein
VRVFERSRCWDEYKLVVRCNPDNCHLIYFTCAWLRPHLGLDCRQPVCPQPACESPMLHYGSWLMNCLRRCAGKPCRRHEVTSPRALGNCKAAHARPRDAQQREARAFKIGCVDAGEVKSIKSSRSILQITSDGSRVAAGLCWEVNLRVWLHHGDA